MRFYVRLWTKKGIESVIKYFIKEVGRKWDIRIRRRRRRRRNKKKYTEEDVPLNERMKYKNVHWNNLCHIRFPFRGNIHPLK